MRYVVWVVARWRLLCGFSDVTCFSALDGLRRDFVASFGAVIKLDPRGQVSSGYRMGGVGRRASLLRDQYGSIGTMADGRNDGRDQAPCPGCCHCRHGFAPAW